MLTRVYEREINLRTIILHIFLVRGEECQGFHELVTLRNGNVSVVQTSGIFAIYVKPPVALENCLVEERGLRTQERFHHQSIVCQCAYVEHLK